MSEAGMVGWVVLAGDGRLVAIAEFQLDQRYILLVRGGSSERFSLLLDCLDMKPSRSFASDNNASVHPEVLEAIRRANNGPAAAYGDDPHTESALGRFREQCGADAAACSIFNGTAANALSMLD